MAKRKKNKHPKHQRVKYTKYKDAWRIAGPSGQIKPGATVMVVTKDGGHDVVRVGAILWESEGRAIAEFEDDFLDQPAYKFKNPKRRGRSR